MQFSIALEKKKDIRLDNNLPEGERLSGTAPVDEP